MAAPSLNELVAQLQAYRILPADQLSVVTGQLVQHFSDPHQLVRDLVLRGWLTPHQANRLLQGRASELAPPAQIITEPTVLDSGVRWRLGLILGVAFLLIFLIALLTRPKPKKQDEPPEPDGTGKGTGTVRRDAPWPDDLKALPGQTESRRDDFQFRGKHTRPDVTIELQGHFVQEEVIVDKVIVREGQIKREYEDLGTVPPSYLATVQTLRELGRRRVY